VHLEDGDSCREIATLYVGEEDVGEKSGELTYLIRRPLPLPTNRAIVEREMPSNTVLASTAVIAVCAYYLVAWLLVGRDPKPGVVVASYEPPRSLSPAMIRFVWKERFDDRAFWAGVLSLVAKGLATMHAENGATRLRPMEAANLRQPLPDEERILLDRLLRGHSRGGIVITMLDPRTVLAASDMAASLHRRAVGTWFRENRTFVTAGIALSVASLFAVEQPERLDQCGVVVLAMAMMAPSAFYLFFLTLRLRDVGRSLREKFDAALIWRGAGLLAFTLSCVAGILLGGIVLGVNFGWPVIVVAGFFTILNVLQLQWMKAPTGDGEKLLTEIEGFRLFLKSVERLPMQRSDAPSDKAGLYEKYLPYAIALELEQAWGDQFLALAATFHQNAGLPGAESFYLGMWDGKPIEIVYKPQPLKGRAF
jgi:hypothetical protein